MEDNKDFRLLIVDDLEAWRELLTDYFQMKLGITATTAIDGDDALEQIERNDFDLILMDMRMPSGTEGLDTLTKIRERKPESKIIMMTAYGSIGTAVEAMKRGAVDFVSKAETTSSDSTEFLDVILAKVQTFQRTQHRISGLIADRERLIRRAYEDARTLTNIQEKGKALEDLVAALFSSVEGFLVFERNCKTATEEIDIVVENRSLDLWWQKLGALFLIECKNWHSKRVGKNEFVLFKEKISNRVPLCKIGFLVCTEQFAETVNKEMVRHSQSEVLVVPIDGDMLRQLIEAPPTQRNRHLSDLVKKASLL